MEQLRFTRLQSHSQCLCCHFSSGWATLGPSTISPQGQLGSLARDPLRNCWRTISTALDDPERVAECFGLGTTPPPGEQSGTWGGPLSVPLHLVVCAKEMVHLLALAPNLKLTPPEYRKLFCDELLN